MTVRGEEAPEGDEAMELLEEEAREMAGDGARTLACDMEEALLEEEEEDVVVRGGASPFMTASAAAVAALRLLWVWMSAARRWRARTDAEKRKGVEARLFTTDSGARVSEAGV